MTSTAAIQTLPTALAGKTEATDPTLPFDPDEVWRNIERWRDAVIERNARTWNLMR